MVYSSEDDMKKRIKKSVTPELRQGWLSRYEAGETPPKIADSDHFNVRTVRKHVDLARQERDSREARSAVLRGALEQHYHDMYELAQEMESNIITGRPVSMDPQEDRRISALRQHLPRSPLWNNIPKWNRTIEEINELAKSMKDRIETELKQDEQVLGIDSQIRDRFISGLIAALNSQVDQWVTGSPGLDLDIHIYKGSFHFQFGKIG